MKTRKLTNEQLDMFFGALGHLLGSGISLGDGLTLLAENEPDAQLRELLQTMARRADEGAPLRQVAAEAGCFPGYACSLLSVGEQVGKTIETLTALARYYAGQERLERQLRAALLYPAMLMLVLLAVAVVLLVWVLPVFNDVYAQLGGSLTGLAGGLLALGGGLRKVLPGIFLVLTVIALILAVPPVRRWLFSRWRLLLGDRGGHGKVLSARFVQALEMAYSSGMADAQAVQLASELTQGEGAAFRKRCKICAEAVERGISLPRALGDGGFLTASDRRLLEASLRSGSGEVVLREISQRMLEKSEEAVARQVSCTEPVLVAVACLLVGTVLLSVMLPLMQIMTAMG